MAAMTPASESMRGLNSAVSAVISERLIKEAIEAEFKSDSTEESESSRQEIPTIQTVTLLRLSFKNIYKIDNLVGLESLVELRLDNNTISRIEHLDHLVNLTWLDLSFNNIPKIEGLETLTNLTDLSLYNNAITTIEGLDSCVNLNCLSLGNNKIKSSDNVHYLRKFRNLEVVNLEGNPLCEEVDYRSTALAYLKYLKYLDWALVEPEEVMHAKETYQDDLMELQDAEAIDAAAQERDAIRAATLAELAAANLDVAETLFTTMFKDDVELPKFRMLLGIQELVDDFEDRFKTSAAAFKQVGLEQFQKMQKDDGDLRAALNEVITEAEQQAIALVVAYKKQAKKVFRAWHSEDDASPKMLDPLREANRQLGAKLKEIEMNRVDSARELLDTYEIALSELRAGALDLQQTFFRAVEDQENAFHAAVATIAEDAMKKYAEGHMSDVGDDLAALLEDRDTMMGAVGSSHDIHVSKLLAAEDACRTTENRRAAKTIASLKETEQKRTRDRMVEIAVMCERNEKAIQALLEEGGEEEYEQ